MNIKNLIFDWSGTLSNDLVPVFSATMDVFDQFNIPRTSLEEFRKVFRLPYMTYYWHYDKSIQKEVADPLFRKHFETYPPPVIYDGVEQTLTKLKQQGMRMIILSSHVTDKMIGEAESYGIKDYFTELNGSIHDKTKAINEIIERNNFAPDDTAYIGDMCHDIHAGQTAGVKTIAITWGYQSREVLAAENPDSIIKTITELPQALTLF